MADVTIGGIAATASALAGADLIEIEQGGISKQAALSLLIGLLLDDDTTLAGDSASKAATQHAVKTAIADAIAGIGPGGASIGVQFLADLSSYTDADPGAGNLRWNNATQGSATVVYLNDASVDGATLTGFWAALDAGGFMYLQHATDQDIWQIWEVTGITDATGYVKLTVANLVNGGSFADSDPMLVTLEQGLNVTGLTISGLTSTQTITSTGTITPLTTNDQIQITAQAAGATFSNPSGTKATGQGFLILIKDNGSSQTIAWGSEYLGMDAALPAATISGKQMAIPVVRAHTLDKWLVFKPSVQP